MPRLAPSSQNRTGPAGLATPSVETEKPDTVNRSASAVRIAASGNPTAKTIAALLRLGPPGPAPAAMSAATGLAVINPRPTRVLGASPAPTLLQSRHRCGARTA